MFAELIVLNIIVLVVIIVIQQALRPLLTLSEGVYNNRVLALTLSIGLITSTILYITIKYLIKTWEMILW